MAHEIKADSNTYVGYNFLTSEYYVKNLETKTATKTAYEAKIVLDITAPRNVISEEAIKALSKDYEPITSINYTLEDTGKYIKTIYFNNYKSFSIQYDEPSLYIQSSNEMWDMSSTLSIDTITTFLWQYYVYHLGLDMPVKIIESIVSYYKSLQNPYVYNVISPKNKKEDILTYSNKFMINDLNKKSKCRYEGIKNPDNIYTLNKYNIIKSGYDNIPDTYNISSVESNKNRINLELLLPEQTIKVGDKIELFDTPDINGIYTVTKIENDNIPEDNSYVPVTHIIVAEDIAHDFVPVYNKNILKIINHAFKVTSITSSKSENYILLESSPAEDELNIDTQIEIFGTGVVDGFYTIKNKNGTKITINETFSESYTPVYNKYIVRESAKKTKENSITCKEEPECNTGDLIQITTSNKIIENLKVTSIIGNKIYVDKDIPELKTSDNGVVWCNSYFVKHIGYDNYVEVNNAKQIWKTVPAEKKIYLYDSFRVEDYYKNMVLYLNMYDKITKVTVAEIVQPNYANGVYENGYIVVNETISAFTHNLDDVPAYLEVHKSFKYPENSITLNAPLFLKKGDTFEITNNSSIKGKYVVDSVEGNKVYVELNNSEKLPELTFQGVNSAIVQLKVYSNRMLLNVSYSRLADKIPVGKFMLDDNEQFTKYLELYNIITPNYQHYIDINQPVTMKYYLGDNLYGNDEGATYMNCIGLYSEHYKDS